MKGVFVSILGQKQRTYEVSSDQGTFTTDDPTTALELADQAIRESGLEDLARFMEVLKTIKADAKKR